MMAIKFHETGSTVRQVASRRCRVETHLHRCVPTFQPLLKQCAEPAAAPIRATLNPDLFADFDSELALVQPFTGRSLGALKSLPIACQPGCACCLSRLARALGQFRTASSSRPSGDAATFTTFGAGTRDHSSPVSPFPDGAESRRC